MTFHIYIEADDPTTSLLALQFNKCFTLYTWMCCQVTGTAHHLYQKLWNFIRAKSAMLTFKENVLTNTTKNKETIYKHLWQIVRSACVTCLSSSLLPSSFVVCQSSFTWRRQIIKSTCILLFTCILLYWWVHFPRSVLFCQPYQQLFTHSSHLGVWAQLLLFKAVLFIIQVSL